jgi:hypothetical protein
MINWIAVQYSHWRFSQHLEDMRFWPCTFDWYYIQFLYTRGTSWLFIRSLSSHLLGRNIVVSCSRSTVIWWKLFLSDRHVVLGLYICWIVHWERSLSRRRWARPITRDIQVCSFRTIRISSRSFSRVLGTPEKNYWPIENDFETWPPWEKQNIERKLPGVNSHARDLIQVCLQIDSIDISHCRAFFSTMHSKDQLLKLLWFILTFQLFINSLPKYVRRIFLRVR